MPGCEYIDPFVVSDYDIPAHQDLRLQGAISPTCSPIYAEIGTWPLEISFVGIAREMVPNL